MVINTIFKTIKNDGIKEALNLLSYYFHKFNTKISNGEVICPICNWHGKSFSPFYLKGCWTRAKARCPSCSSLERHRYFYLYYKKEFEYYKKKSIKCLHFAPESCLSGLFEIAGIEHISSEYKSPGVGDMQDIKEADESFDIVISHHVLEHVENDKKALSEIYRILKPGGVSYLSIPVNVNREETIEYGCALPEDNYHFRDYGYDVIKRFYPFNCEQIDSKNYFSKKELQLYGLNANEPLYKLKKLN